MTTEPDPALVEAVARALVIADNGDPDRDVMTEETVRVFWGAGNEWSDATTVKSWELEATFALAAITAIREWDKANG